MENIPKNLTVFEANARLQADGGPAARSQSDDDRPVPRLDLRGLTKTAGSASGVRSTSIPSIPNHGNENQQNQKNQNDEYATRPSRLRRTTTTRARIAADWDADDLDA